MNPTTYVQTYLYNKQDLWKENFFFVWIQVPLQSTCQYSQTVLKSIPQFVEIENDIYNIRYYNKLARNILIFLISILWILTLSIDYLLKLRNVVKPNPQGYDDFIMLYFNTVLCIGLVYNWIRFFKQGKSFQIEQMVKSKYYFVALTFTLFICQRWAYNDIINGVQNFIYIGEKGEYYSYSDLQGIQNMQTRVFSEDIIYGLFENYTTETPQLVDNYLIITDQTNGFKILEIIDENSFEIIYENELNGDYVQFNRISYDNNLLAIVTAQSQLETDFISIFFFNIENILKPDLIGIYNYERNQDLEEDKFYAVNCFFIPNINNKQFLIHGAQISSLGIENKTFIINLQNSDNIFLEKTILNLDNGLSGAAVQWELNLTTNYIYCQSQDFIAGSDEQGIFLQKLILEPEIDIQRISYYQTPGISIFTIKLSQSQQILYQYLYADTQFLLQAYNINDPENMVLITEIEVEEIQNQKIIISEDQKYLFLDNQLFSIQDVLEGYIKFMGLVDVGQYLIIPQNMQPEQDYRQAILLYSFTSYISLYKIFTDEFYYTFQVEIVLAYTHIHTGIQRNSINDQVTVQAAIYYNEEQQTLIWMKLNSGDYCRYIIEDGFAFYPVVMSDQNKIRFTLIRDEFQTFSQVVVDFKDGDCPYEQEEHEEPKIRITPSENATFYDQESSEIFLLLTRGNSHLAFQQVKPQQHLIVHTISSVDDINITDNILGSVLITSITEDFVYHPSEHLDTVSLLLHNSNEVMFVIEGIFYLINFDDNTNPYIKIEKSIEKEVIGQFIITQDYKHIVIPLGVQGFQILNIESTVKIIYVNYLLSNNIQQFYVDNNFDQIGVTGKNINYFNIQDLLRPVKLQNIVLEFGFIGQMMTMIRVDHKTSFLISFESIQNQNYSQIFIYQFTTSENFLAIDNLQPMKVNEQFKKGIKLFKQKNGGEISLFKLQAAQYITPVTNQQIDLPSWLQISFNNKEITGLPTKEFSGQKVLIRVEYTYLDQYNLEISEDSYISFDVVSTLQAQIDTLDDGENNFLQFNTTSNFLNVKIQLFEEFQNNKIKFIVENIGAVSSSYDSKKGELILFGPASEVNSAFQQIRYTYLIEQQIDPSIIYFSIYIDDIVNQPVLVNLYQRKIGSKIFQFQQLQDNDGENFNLSIFKRNKPPTPLQNDIFYEQNIKEFLNIIIPQFIDEDNDNITYQIQFCENNQEQCVQLPDWLIFVPERLQLQGYFREDLLLIQDLLEKTIYFKIIATDSYDQNIIFLPIVVWTETPQFNINIQDEINKQVQSKQIIPHPGTYFEFEFQDSFFQDSSQIFIEGFIQKNNRRILQNIQSLSSDQLKQLVLNNPDQWIQITESSQDTWLNINSNKKSLYGTPQNTDLGNFKIIINVSDGYSQNFSTFNLEVTNSVPQIQDKLQDQIKTFPSINEPFEFKFSGNTFVDPDNDTLKYEYKLIRGDTLPVDFAFDPQERVISGTFESVTSDKPFFLGKWFGILKENLEIEFSVTDGINSQQVSDVLMVEVEGTTIYAIQKLMEFLGPLAGIFGLYKYRPLIFKMACKKKYQYKKPIKVNVGETMNIQIFLMFQTIHIFEKIWKNLKNNYKNQQEQKKYTNLDFIKNYLINFNEEQIEIIIDIKKMYQDINDELYKLDLIEAYKPQLIDEYERQHRFSIFFLCEIAKELSKLDKFKYQAKILKQIKELGAQQQQNELDWYHSYVQEIEILNLEQQQNYQLPKIKFDFQLYQSKLDPTLELHQSYLLVIEDLNQNLMLSLEEQQQNFNILKYLLLRKIFSLRFQSSFAQFSHGLSVEAKASQIHNVLTKELSEIARIEKVSEEKKCQEFFDFGPSELVFMSGSQPKPDWIDIKEQFDIINISGIPHDQNQGMIVMTILNQQEIVLREFSVDIVNNREKITKNKWLQKLKKKETQLNINQEDKKSLINNKFSLKNMVTKINDDQVDQSPTKENSENKNPEKIQKQESLTQIFNLVTNKSQNNSQQQNNDKKKKFNLLDKNVNKHEQNQTINQNEESENIINDLIDQISQKSSKSSNSNKQYQHIVQKDTKTIQIINNEETINSQRKFQLDQSVKNEENS